MMHLTGEHRVRKEAWIMAWTAAGRLAPCERAERVPFAERRAVGSKGSASMAAS